MNDTAMCETQYAGTEDASTITITGRFDATMDEDFFSCYENIKSKKVVIDMAEAQYMDRSALSMLLKMRERFGGDNAQITLQHCSEKIKTLLQKANYQWFFTIQE